MKWLLAIPHYIVLFFSGWHPDGPDPAPTPAGATLRRPHPRQVSSLAGLIPRK